MQCNVNFSVGDDEEDRQAMEMNLSESDHENGCTLPIIVIGVNMHRTIILDFV